MDDRKERYWQGAILRLLFSVFFVLLLGAAQPARFECDRVRPSSVLKPAYARIAKSNVCEGFYERNVSQPFLELLSFTLNSPAAWAQAGEQERIHLIAAKTTTSTVLHIQPLSISTLYRVDASLPADGLHWSPAQLRRTTNLSLSDVGFLATAGQTPSRSLIVVPIWTDKSATHPQTAFATVRVSAKTTSLKWRAYPAHRTQAQSPEWHEGIDRPLYPWESVTLAIALPDDGSSVNVEIKGNAGGAAAAEPMRILVAGNDHEQH